MTVTSVHKDPAARTMTITAELDAPVERVWQLWADPRQVERWWGPPGVPLAVLEHDLRPGGTVAYVVTGPDGDRMAGSWHVQAVDAPHGLEFALHGPGIPPVATRVRLEARPGGTRMTIRTTFPSDGAMDQLLAMGVDRGLATAVGRADDALLAGPRPAGPA